MVRTLSPRAKRPPAEAIRDENGGLDADLEPAFTLLINYPEVAILGIARARWEPVVLEHNGRFRIGRRLRLPVGLAFDHRLNDGADAARFASSVVATLSNPARYTLVT